MNALESKFHALARHSPPFAYVALSCASRGAQAPIARKLLQRQQSHEYVTLEGESFDYATFGPESSDLAQLVCLVGDLKSAVVVVRGRLYPPGQHTRLYQWLTCHRRMVAMELPISACDYMTGGLRLPCSLLGSFHAHERDAHADHEAFYAIAASRDGLDCCPRFIPERLIRIR